MRTVILAAAAIGFLGLQTAANADQVARYQGAINVQHISAPQRTQAFAQAEGTGSQTRYGRGYAQAEGPRGQITYGRGYAQAEGTGGQTSYGRQLAQAEGTGGQTNYGRQLAQAEGTRGQTSYGRQLAQAEAPTVAQAQRYAAAEQTGADNARLA